MTRQHWVVPVLLAVLAGGCGASGTSSSESPAGPEPSSSASPTITIDADDALRWEQVRDAIPVTGGLILAGGTTDATGEGEFTVTADLATARFEARISNEAHDVTVRHRDQTTWVLADPAYWVAAGYTPESAASAEGRWVLLDQIGSQRYRDQYGPGAVLAPLSDLAASDLTVSRRSDREGVAVIEFDFVTDGTPRTVVVTADGDPWVVEVTATRDGAVATTRLTRAPGPVEISVPDADTVVGAS
ncbi:hypothetical protein HMPREF0063_11733 [Aeromicrobium marinum DSM 15272]|uniref:Lipoprotein n=1 Tax=Aeromicrobium marinum DSM 15272 TaxID=585531 RepID=E2SDE7_9ACTN|nr:hypothetical protein [Aeromicrobium marinum]EFQ82524.1 hypothetical protein HMPREF0063_11733 [Aeromicrobium marinum DSM 15272]